MEMRDAEERHRLSDLAPPWRFHSGVAKHWEGIMRFARMAAFAALVALAGGCDTYAGCSGNSKPATYVPDETDEQDTQSLDGAPPDASAADAPAPDATAAEGSEFVPMAEDLIVRLDYGAEMDGPGWYEVLIIDPDLPGAAVCQTRMDTTSEEGLSAYGSEDYHCSASVFNANSANRTDPHDFVIYITNSHGNELSYPLTWQGGSFTNEVGNVLSYQVP